MIELSCLAYTWKQEPNKGSGKRFPLQNSLVSGEYLTEKQEFYYDDEEIGFPELNGEVEEEDLSMLIIADLDNEMVGDMTFETRIK